MKCDKFTRRKPLAITADFVLATSVPDLKKIDILPRIIMFDAILLVETS